MSGELTYIDAAGVPRRAIGVFLASGPTYIDSCGVQRSSVGVFNCGAATYVDGAGVTRSSVGIVGINATPPGGGSVLAGLYPNGASNTRLRAAIARVKAGIGRARMAVKSDSTSMGAFAGSGGAYGLNGARPNRWTAKLASKLTAAGIPALDTAVVGDNGSKQSGVTLPAYDTRWSAFGTNWDTYVGQSFAGGADILAGNGLATIADPGMFDRVEIVMYGLAGRELDTLVNGAYPTYVSDPVSGEQASQSYHASKAAATGGFQAFTVGLASPAAGMSLGMASAGAAATPSTGANLRSIRFYNSQAPALDILNHGVAGARAADQMADNTDGNNWSGKQALAFDAPDFAILQCGLNEVIQGDDSNPTPTIAAFNAAAQSFIDTTRISGDPIIVIPYPTILSTQKPNLWAALVAASKSIAASNGVTCFSLWDYYGASFTPTIAAQLAADGVHGSASWYDGEASAILAMLQQLL